MLALTPSKIIQIFIDCDDFLLEFQPILAAASIGHASKPDSILSASEIITMLILYHHSRTDCFKSYYELVVLKELKSYFPAAPSYPHFVKLKKHYLLELFAFLHHKCLAAPTPEANFVDSKKLESCHIKRAHQHKTMQGLAVKGRTSTG